MYPLIGRLLKLEYYGKRKWLRLISGFQFWLSFILIFLPVYFNPLLRVLQNSATPTAGGTNFATTIITFLISGMSIINMFRESLLSRSQIVNIDYTKKFIRHFIMLLLDTYKLKHTCRATLFVPSYPNKDTIEVYDRISIGRDPGYKGKCFFRNGQGIPGMAWKNAWSAESDKGLIDAIQIGNVPESVLKDKCDVRKFFRDKFSIQDDDIYESLGDGKLKIRSYMAVGILGPYKDLIGVLAIDSEEENQFIDFEQLKQEQTGTLHRKVSIFGTSGPKNKNDDVLPIKPDLPNINIEKYIQGLFNSLVKQQKQMEWNETSRKMREMGFLIQAEHSRRVEAPVEQFLFALGWVLKQIRGIRAKEFDAEDIT